MVVLGILVAGQEQASVGGGFDEATTMVGNVFRVNMWSKKLTKTEMSAWSGMADYFEGDVVGWSEHNWVETNLLPGCQGTPISP